MPVVTRSQSRNLHAQIMNEIEQEMQECRDLHLEYKTLEYQTNKDYFIGKFRILTIKHENTKNAEESIRNLFEVFQLINRELPFLLNNCAKYDTPMMFIKFANAILKKVQYVNEKNIDANGWPHIDQSFVSDFMTECSKANKIAKEYISNQDELSDNNSSKGGKQESVSKQESVYNQE